MPLLPLHVLQPHPWGQYVVAPSCTNAAGAGATAMEPVVGCASARHTGVKACANVTRPAASDAASANAPAPPPDSGDLPGPGMTNLPTGFDWWEPGQRQNQPEPGQPGGDFGDEGS